MKMEQATDISGLPGLLSFSLTHACSSTSCSWECLLFAALCDASTSTQVHVAPKKTEFFRSMQCGMVLSYVFHDTQNDACQNGTISTKNILQNARAVATGEFTLHTHASSERFIAVR